MGSKRRIWKYIAPIILKNREEKQYYVEPFCGGCNSICQVDGLRIAADINPYLIAMWKDLLHGEKYPETISKEDYEKAKTLIRPMTARLILWENLAGLVLWLLTMESFIILILE